MVPNLLKPSRLGEIPQDWKRVRLSEVMKVRQGLQIAISDRLKEPTSTSKEYITIQSIKKTDQVREYVEAPSQRVICTKDDVLMTRTGNTGIVVTDVEGAFHNNFFLMDFDKDKIDKTFLVNYLRSPRVQHLILTKAGASTIPDLNHKDFYSVEFPLAPVLEQQKIAKILSTWDKAISTTERLIENSNQQKKALMQQLLTGKKRLLDESGKRFEGDWEQSTLGSICKFSQGFQVGVDEQTPEQKDGLVRFIRIVDYTKESEPARYIAPKSNYYKVDKQDVVMVRYGEAGLTCRGYEGVIANNLFLISPDKGKLSKAYLFKFLRYNFKNISVLAASSTMPALKFTDLKMFKIEVPLLPEQQKIATVLTNADKEIELLEQQLADLQQEKKALMQVLLTGKKRVVVDGG